MAGFKTHITTSTVLGIGYGTGALFGYNVPWESCVLAGGLCSVGGMLPDIDSDSGVPLRESLSFGAAVIPMFMLDRFARMGMTFQQFVLAGGMIYLFIRFVLGGLLMKYTVHRGMFHSIPACLICGELTFLICSADELTLRYFEAGGVMLGFMSHLMLDEIWSLDMQHGRLHFKKSFGTAMKFWGDSLWANFSTYAKVMVLTFLVLQDPVWMGRFNLDGVGGQEIKQFAREVVDKLQR